MKIRKTFICTALIVLFVAPTTLAQWKNKKVKGNGTVTTKTVATGTYDIVKAVGPMDFVLERGAEGSITVIADDNLHEYIVIETDGNELTVKLKKGISITSKNDILVTIPFEDLSAVALVGSGDLVSKDTIKSDTFETWVTGSGDLTLPIESYSLQVKVTGSGDLMLSGSTNDLSIKISGSGDFEGTNLVAQHTEVNITGSGSAKFTTKQSIQARISGSGDVRYAGNPTKSDTKVYGSGSIKSM